jgi:hypothetical protein
MNEGVDSSAYRRPLPGVQMTLGSKYDSEMVLWVGRHSTEKNIKTFSQIL